MALAEGGIDNIKAAALDRASIALHEIADDIHTHDVSNVKIIGTAALRSASNASSVHDLVKEILGRNIEVIDGSREAELIYKGIMLLPGANIGTKLIMDIGGGSTEFIIVQDGDLLWSHSFNIGVGVLHELFHKSEPISTPDVERMQKYLTEVLQPLREQLQNYTVDSIIGASGSFEVLASMQQLAMASDELMTIDTELFVEMEQAVISSDFEDRAQIPGMPASRVKLIVVAFVLLRHIIEMAGAGSISISPYAIKEGLLSEM